MIRLPCDGDGVIEVKLNTRLKIHYIIKKNSSRVKQVRPSDIQFFLLGFKGNIVGTIAKKEFPSAKKRKGNLFK